MADNENNPALSPPPTPANLSPSLIKFAPINWNTAPKPEVPRLHHRRRKSCSLSPLRFSFSTPSAEESDDGRPKARLIEEKDEDLSPRSKPSPKPFLEDIEEWHVIEAEDEEEDQESDERGDAKRRCTENLGKQTGRGIAQEKGQKMQIETTGETRLPVRSASHPFSLRFESK